MLRRSPIRGPNRAPLGPEHAFLALSDACESHLCGMPGPVSPEFAGPVARLARPARRGRLRVCGRETHSTRVTVPGRLTPHRTHLARDRVVTVDSAEGESCKNNALFRDFFNYH